MCSALERRHAPTGNKGRSPSQRAARFMSSLVSSKRTNISLPPIACHPLILTNYRNLIVLVNSGVMRL